MYTSVFGLLVACQNPMISIPCFLKSRLVCCLKRECSKSIDPGPSARTVYVLSSKQRELGATFLSVTPGPQGAGGPAGAAAGACCGAWALAGIAAAVAATRAPVSRIEEIGRKHWII